MIEVTNEQRQEYFKEEANKEFSVRFPKLNKTFLNSDIVSESFELKESIFDQDSLEFVGCIASQMKIRIAGVYQDLRGQDIEVYVSANWTDPIQLFGGIVDSCEYVGNKRTVEIIAYDDLYSISDKNIYDWWVDFAKDTFQPTIKEFRDSLFDYLGIEQVRKTLVNDNKKILSIESMIDIVESSDDFNINALETIKNICQINGVFGMMKRNRRFDYRKIGAESTDTGAYPGIELVPPFFPGVGNIDTPTDSVYLPHYRSVDYKNYSVHKITKVAIRQEKGVKSEKAGTGSYRYFVQGNMFTLGSSPDIMHNMAAALLDNIKDVSYVPFNSVSIGLPFVEVGDCVQYYVYDYQKSRPNRDVYEVKSFYILSRTMKGLQSLVDTYSATGSENQKTFISDMGFRENVSTAEIKSEVDKTNKEVKEQDKRIETLENEKIEVLSVAALPPDAGDHPNTIYLIQGTVG